MELPTSLTRCNTSTTSFYALPTVTRSRSGGGLGSSGYIHPAWLQRSRANARLSPLAARPIDPQNYKRLELPVYGGRDYMHTRMQVAPRYLNFLTEEPKHPPRMLGSTQAKIRAAQKKAQQKAQRSRRATLTKKPERSEHNAQKITSKEVRDAFGAAGRENLMIFDLADADGTMAITFDQVCFAPRTFAHIAHAHVHVNCNRGSPAKAALYACTLMRCRALLAPTAF